MADHFARMRTDPSFQPQEIDDVRQISPYNQTYLQEAIVSRHDCAVFFIENGVDLDHQDDRGQTAPQYAISRSLNDIAMKLIEKGANPNIVDQWGNNSLWTAVMNPKPKKRVIEGIFFAGADPFHKNNTGRSAYDMAKNEKLRRFCRSF